MANYTKLFQGWIDAGRMDVSESAFFARQLESVRAQAFEVQFAPLKGRLLVPVNNSIHPGAEEYTYRAFTEFGSARISSSYAKDAPRADIEGTETTVKIRGIQSSYGVSLQEMRAAQLAQMPLSARKATACRNTIERKQDKVLLEGDTTMGLKGLFNQTLADVTEHTIITGVGGFLWTEKTPDEIVLDLTSAVDQVVVDTLEVEAPNTMVLSTARKRLIANTRMGDGSDTTIMEFFLQTNDHITSIQSSAKLATAGAGSVQRMVCYDRNANKLEGLIPQEFEQLPPEVRGYETVNLCHARTGGVVLYFPKSVCYADGI